MAADDGGPGGFRGARFTGEDFTGADFRDCDLRRVKITDSFLTDVRVSGLIGKFVVNDVDVTAYVEGELDRQHPERVQVRAMRTADDFRAMWDTLERLWPDTVARAARLPEPALQQRVDDEWSFTETLRHLIYCIDKWASRTILDEPVPPCGFGLPCRGCTAADAAAVGVDLDACPSLAEVMKVRENRMALVRGILDELTDAGLERVCPRPSVPDYLEEPISVGRCLRVIMGEECEHRRYAVRDLAVLEAHPSPEPRGVLYES
jgi:DinB superfamily/Pentapeptide repeats (8 copies)